ncbi:hypothetical protein [Marinobacterium sedimentorum]|uniref:hypothetical protein n=1 Tax=Marinobacterium sedimentorum TaxID=2927804 RepID=UPI0020C65621|nr:hypothetical protein [Marinobacterium sedimentorum]MCP8687732.1 hypothetical protein [Marinobacterium sedimentorum]
MYRFAALLLSLLPLPSLASGDLIPYQVLERSELGSIKLSLTVEVPLVDGRLPNEQEIGAISEHLVDEEPIHQRSFVVFYLPGMTPGAGAFATAHHNPDMEVQILDYMLMQYPQYVGLLD